MAKDKQRVFSARTTEEGLRALNELKVRLGIGWDDLVIGAVNAHYDADIPKVPRVERPKKERSLKPKEKSKNKRG